MINEHGEGKKFSAIILAAGLSKRMGQPKLTLPYDSEHSFLEALAWKFHEFGCDEVVVVVNATGQKAVETSNMRFPANAKFVLNTHPEWQRFYSLKLAVERLKPVDYAFVHNIDNPFINAEVLRDLLSNTKSADYVLPAFNGGKGGHPFLMSAKIISTINQVTGEDHHLKHFLKQFPTCRVPVEDEKVLVNINTMEEYGRYFSA